MYRCPDGRHTTSEAVALREWHKLSRAAAKALDCEVVAFNPRIQLREPGSYTDTTISVGIAKKIVALAEKAKSNGVRS